MKASFLAGSSRPSASLHQHPWSHSHVLLAQQLAPDLHHEAVQVLALEGPGQVRTVTRRGGGKATWSQAPAPTQQGHARGPGLRHSSASLRGSRGTRRAQGSFVCCPLMSLPTPTPVGPRGVPTTRPSTGQLGNAQGRAPGPEDPGPEAARGSLCGPVERQASPWPPGPWSC